MPILVMAFDKISKKMHSYRYTYNYIPVCTLDKMLCVGDRRPADHETTNGALVYCCAFKLHVQGWIRHVRVYSAVIIFDQSYLNH